MSLLWPFLDSHLTTYHSNIGVCIIVVSHLGTSTLLVHTHKIAPWRLSGKSIKNTKSIHLGKEIMRNSGKIIVATIQSSRAARLLYKSHLRKRGPVLSSCWPTTRIISLSLVIHVSCSIYTQEISVNFWQ